MMLETVESLELFPARASDKLRYRDTDAQGHVNNAVFSTFLETARTEILYARNGTGEPEILDPGCGFVIARVEMDYLAEALWPGTVEIGTRVLKLGNSSLTLQQTVFQNQSVIARAQTVMVQVDLTTRKPHPLSAAARGRLAALT